MGVEVREWETDGRLCVTLNGVLFVFHMTDGDFERYLVLEHIEGDFRRVLKAARKMIRELMADNGVEVIYGKVRNPRLKEFYRRVFEAEEEYAIMKLRRDAF